MEISEKIYNSKIMFKSIKQKISLTVVLLKELNKISQKTNKGYTLLAICPNSEYVLRAAIYSAKRANSPIMFAATLNQVDTDGGYTGWTPLDLVRKIKEESYKIGYEGPTIIAIDHGGPWLKDKQNIEKWSLEKSMEWIKNSFEAAIIAGYDLIHVDTTIDIFKRNLNIETVVERTIELISHSESYRKAKGKPPISYEVGTEEVHGGLTNLNTFNKFLVFLEEGLQKQNLKYLWPTFIVAKVGTDLHTTSFDPHIAQIVVKKVSNYGSYIKGHYTDFVSNPELYPVCGIGAANIGPELTIAEFDALNELCSIEKKLYKQNKIACLSYYKDKLTNAVIESGRWKKWLLEDEKDFNLLSDERKEWLLKTSCRYIWAVPEVKCSQIVLFNNLKINGIEAENWLLINIEKYIDKYFRAFNLININEKIQKNIKIF